MPDGEWIKTLEDWKMVGFTYQELPKDWAFMTAQIAENVVVYSFESTEAINAVPAARCHP